MSNYTTEQVNNIIAVYKASGPTYDNRCDVVQELADKYETSVHSIRAVLVQNSIYKKKTYRNKTGKEPVTKDRFVALMEDHFKLMPGRLESLTKANKTVLIWMMKEFIARGDDPNLFKNYL